MPPYVRLTNVDIISSEFQRQLLDNWLEYVSHMADDTMSAERPSTRGLLQATILLFQAQQITHAGPMKQPLLLYYLV